MVCAASAISRADDGPRQRPHARLRQQHVSSPLLVPTLIGADQLPARMAKAAKRKHVLVLMRQKSAGLFS